MVPSSNASDGESKFEVRIRENHQLADGSISKSDMASHLSNGMSCLKRRTDVAPFAREKHQAGVEVGIQTMITRQGKSEEFCAIHAIDFLDTLKMTSRGFAHSLSI